jgi:hypothetical protein
MAGFDAAIHVLPLRRLKGVDARDKPGHDELRAGVAGAGRFV